MKKLALKLGAAAVAFAPSLALAQSQSPPTGIVDTGSDLENLLDTVRDWFFTVFVVLSVVFLIWSAFLFLTAAGNETKHAKAKNALIYAIIAIVIALVAGSLPSLLASILGA